MEGNIELLKGAIALIGYGLGAVGPGIGIGIALGIALGLLARRED